MIVLEFNGQNVFDTVVKIFDTLKNGILDIYGSIPIFVQPIVICYIMISLAFLFIGRDG